MNFTEYSQWMSIAAVVVLLVTVFVSRKLRNTAITKPKLQKGATILAIVILSILLIWGIMIEVLR